MNNCRKKVKFYGYEKFSQNIKKGLNPGFKSTYIT